MEEFVPGEPGLVRMYVCGPTVYDHAHLGHARSDVFFDTVARYLGFTGFRVTHVRNFTDIDDKIIQRSQLMNMGVSEVAGRFIDAYHADMARLGARPPDHEPRVTEHIPVITSLIDRLISQGYAYVHEGDVLFRAAAVDGYGLLARAGDRAGMNGSFHAAGNTAAKEDRRDFVLWKRSSGLGPVWESPWGPGWHVECAAMARNLLGAEFDIHGGGRDLLFPHHENERAISRACSGTHLARYWIHHAMVTVGNRTLSRSSGPPHLVGELCRRYHGEAIRLFILSTHYRRSLDFTTDRLDQAEAALARLYRLYDRLEKGPESPRDCPDSPLIARFCQAVENDLNFPGGINVIFAAVRRLNRVMRENPGAATAHAHDRQELAGLIRLCREVLGILADPPACFLKDHECPRSNARGRVPSYSAEV